MKFVFIKQRRNNMIKKLIIYTCASVVFNSVGILSAMEQTSQGGG